MTDQTPAPPPVDENHLIAERRAKLAALREQGIAFPNDFRRADHAGDLQDSYADAERWTGEALEGEGRRVALAGRLLAKRVMGKAAFAQVQDVSRSEEQTSELQSLMRISYAVFCLKKKSKQS